MKRVVTLTLVGLLTLAPSAFGEDHNGNGFPPGPPNFEGGDQSQEQSQSQLQIQGQDQSQSATGIGIGTSEASSEASSANSQAVSITNSESNKVEVPAAAPSPVSPDLVTGRDTCMGSVSAGAGASTGLIGAGLSFGKTYTDKNCNRRKFAAMLDHMGLRDAALSLIARNDEVAEALTAAGVPFKQLVATTVPEPVTSYTHGMDVEDSSILGITE